MAPKRKHGSPIEALKKARVDSSLPSSSVTPDSRQPNEDRDDQQVDAVARPQVDDQMFIERIETENNLKILPFIENPLAARYLLFEFCKGKNVDHKVVATAHPDFIDVITKCATVKNFDALREWRKWCNTKAACVPNFAVSRS
jgi:hypothetical protein